MPELPEVENARYILEKFGINQKIIEVLVLEQGNGPRTGHYDNLVFDSENQTYNMFDFINAFQDKTIDSVNRKGKQMWISFKEKESKSVLIHLGMTGAWLVRGQDIPQYKSVAINKEDKWPPKFTKLELVLSNGHRICFVDPRRLGRIRLRSENPMNELPLSKLGLDVSLNPLPSSSELFAKFSNMKTSIKVILLDQESVFSGIGNWIADEVLYQSGIHPETKANAISIDKLNLLIQSLFDIVKTAISCLKDNQEFPNHWLFHYRWKKRSKSKMPDGSNIIFSTVGGRTSAVVPKAQGYTGLVTPASASEGITDNTDALESVTEGKIPRTTTTKKRKRTK